MSQHSRSYDNDEIEFKYAMWPIAICVFDHQHKLNQIASDEQKYTFFSQLTKQTSTVNQIFKTQVVVDIDELYNAPSHSSEVSKHSSQIYDELEPFAFLDEPQQDNCWTTHICNHKCYFIKFYSLVMCRASGLFHECSPNECCLTIKEDIQSYCQLTLRPQVFFYEKELPFYEDDNDCGNQLYSHNDNYGFVNNSIFGADVKHVVNYQTLNFMKNSRAFTRKRKRRQAKLLLHQIESGKFNNVENDQIQQVAEEIVTEMDTQADVEKQIAQLEQKALESISVPNRLASNNSKISSAQKQSSESNELETIRQEKFSQLAKLCKDLDDIRNEAGVETQSNHLAKYTQQYNKKQQLAASVAMEPLKNSSKKQRVINYTRKVLSQKIVGTLTLECENFVLECLDKTNIDSSSDNGIREISEFIVSLWQKVINTKIFIQKQSSYRFVLHCICCLADIQSGLGHMPSNQLIASHSLDRNNLIKHLNQVLSKSFVTLDEIAIKGEAASKSSGNKVIANINFKKQKLSDKSLSRKQTISSKSITANTHILHEAILELIENGQFEYNSNK